LGGEDKRIIELEIRELERNIESFDYAPWAQAQGEELYSISKDSILCYGVCMIVVDGKCLEGVGVEPDIVVPFDVRFSAGRDVQLERAKDEMVKVIEASHLSLWENHKRVTTSCMKGF